MPVFTPEYLHKVAYHIYRAKGVSHEEAEVVATHQVKANLVGHDSHGVIHISEYVERINKGHIVPGAPFVDSLHIQQGGIPHACIYARISAQGGLSHL